jgi:DNA mismatch repair ATPase MutS
MFKGESGNLSDYLSNKKENQLVGKGVDKLDYLRSTESRAALEIRSEDKELIEKPPIIQQLREANLMWELILSPLTDLEQIKARQELLTVFKETNLLEEIRNEKNTSYLIRDSIDSLFSLVDINDYDKMPLIDAYRTGHRRYEGDVMENLQKLSEGKDGLAQLIDTFTKVDEPLIVEVRDNLKKDLKGIDFLNDKYFLDGKYNDGLYEKATEKLDVRLKYLGSTIEMAQIASRDECAMASFDENRAIGFKDAWNFLRDKKGEKPQVFNDSPADKPLTILCGPNTGGKSFSLQSNWMCQLLAQSFGCIPAREGNFQIYDSFSYLDRPSTQAEFDLSANGTEVINWIAALNKMGKKTYMVVDEGFSTTSAEDQYCMMMGVSEYLSKRGGKTLLSTHNEEFLENSQDKKDVGIYHFPIKVDRNSKNEVIFNYSHKLTEGIGDSMALEIAEFLGLDQELISLAKDYLNGKVDKIIPLSNIEWPKLEAFTEDERLALKKNKKNNIFFDQARDGSKMFQVFSTDRELRDDSHIYTGEGYGIFSDIHFGGWICAEPVVRQKLIFKMLTEGEKLNSKQILERQKTFAELSKNDRYQEFLDVGEKISFAYKFLPLYSLAFNSDDGSFLGFNKEFAPPGDHLRFDHESIDYCINYLRLNQKLLGSEFSSEYVKLLKKFEDGSKLLKKMKDYFSNLDVGEIGKGWNKILEKKIEDPSVVAAFNEFVGAREEEKKWQGELTLLKLARYEAWIEKRDYQRSKEFAGDQPWKKYLDEFKKIRGIRYVRNFDADLIKKRYKKLAYRIESQEMIDKWQECICKERIKELIESLYSRSDYSYEGYVKRCNGLKELEEQINSAKDDWDIQDETIRKMIIDLFDLTDTNIVLSNNFVWIEFRKFYEIWQNNGDGKLEKFSSRSFFDCDLNLIRPELKNIINHIREWHRGHDYNYLHQWPAQVILAMILDQFIDENDCLKQYTALLRSYDSVYLHQIANSFEYMTRDFMKPMIKKRSDDEDYWPFMNDEDEEKNEIIEARGVKDFFNFMQTTYDLEVKEMYKDYVDLQKAYSEIFNQSGISGRMMCITDVKNILNYQEAKDYEKIQNVMITFEQLQGKSSPYRDEILDFEIEEEEVVAKYKEFYQKEIIDTGLKEKIEKLVEKLEGEAYYLSLAFMNKYGIPLERKEAYRKREEAILAIESGNLDFLRWEIKRKFLSKLKDYEIEKGEEFDDSHSFSYGDGRRDTISDKVYEGQALALFGHMINTLGYCPVKFNTSGEIGFKKMFNVFKTKEGQVMNDMHFDQEKKINIVAAPNMSGKTYMGKSIDMAILSGLNTGFAPANEATIPILDHVVYLDRVTAKMDKNLSALGNEVEVWKKLKRVVDKEEKEVLSLSSIDEAFSTTSPKYQAALVYAIVMKMIKKGQYAWLATHNHDVVNILRNIEKDYLQAYTIDTEIDKNGKVKFNHIVRKMKPEERSFSDAIPVARTLGLPEEILQLAEKYKAIRLLKENGSKRQNLD